VSRGERWAAAAGRSAFSDTRGVVDREPEPKRSLRGSLLQLPHEAAGSLGGLGPWWLDQQMEVLWHEHPADEEEIRLLPKLPPDLDQGAAEAVAVKEFKAAVSTGGDKLPFAGLKMASLDGHEQIYRRNKTKGY